MQMGMTMGCELYQRVLPDFEDEADEATGDRSSTVQSTGSASPARDDGTTGSNASHAVTK